MISITLILTERGLALLAGISPSYAHRLISEQVSEQISKQISKQNKGVKSVIINELSTTTVSKLVSNIVSNPVSKTEVSTSSLNNLNNKENNKEKDNINIILKEKEKEISPPPTPSKPKVDMTDVSQFDWVEPEYKDSFQKFITFKWIEFKSKYKDERYLKQAYNKLVRLSNNDPEKAKLIVDQSIDNRWQGLFALKENSSSSNSIGTIIHDNNDTTKYTSSKLKGW